MTPEEHRALCWQRDSPELIAAFASFGWGLALRVAVLGWQPMAHPIEEWMLPEACMDDALLDMMVPLP